MSWPIGELVSGPGHTRLTAQPEVVAPSENNSRVGPPHSDHHHCRTVTTAADEHSNSAPGGPRNTRGRAMKSIFHAPPPDL